MSKSRQKGLICTCGAPAKCKALCNNCYSKKYYYDHPGVQKVRRRSYKLKVRRSALKLFGDKCNWPGCKWKDPRALQIDHINGGGGKENRALGGSFSICLKILRMANPYSEYQLLCANHNWVKRDVNKETTQPE